MHVLDPFPILYVYKISTHTFTIETLENSLLEQIFVETKTFTQKVTHLLLKVHRENLKKQPNKNINKEKTQKNKKSSNDNKKVIGKTHTYVDI